MPLSQQHQMPDIGGVGGRVAVQQMHGNRLGLGVLFGEHARGGGRAAARGGGR